MAVPLFRLRLGFLLGFDDAFFENAMGEVGLLFVDFQNQWRLRLNGVATVEPNDPLMAEYPEAQLIVRINVSEVFGNCPRYVHKMQLVERSRFVPHAACETPVPDWKRGDWVADVLPANDPARRATEEEE